MASFYKRRKEEIPSAKKVEELRHDLPQSDLDQLELEVKLSNSSCWNVVFSPDESHFAWISGPTKVLLVPWNRTRTTADRPPISKVPELESPTTGNEQLQFSCQVTKKDDIRPWIPIECGFPILSVAFGSGTPQLNGSAPSRFKPHWTRFDFSKEIVLATGHTNGRIRIWNVRTGTLLLELIGHKMGVRDLSFAPDGSLRLISASLDKTLRGWDLHDDGSLFKTFFAHQNSVVCCCWSPNGKLMASAGADKTAIIWDMVNYTVLRRLDGHLHEVVSCSFSPDGAVLATASWDSKVILWDPYTGVELRSLYHLHPPPNMIYASGANSAWVRGVSFARNGLNIATISDDHLVRFWNLTGDIDPEVIATEEDEALSCAYSPSGSCLGVGTSKFKVSFYTTPAVIPSLAHIARMAVRRLVTTSEVNTLEIPVSLKSYLKYESWD